MDAQSVGAWCCCCVDTDDAGQSAVSNRTGGLTSHLGVHDSELDKMLK
jgi:hypothetical protein